MTSAPPCAAVSPPRMRERRPRCGGSDCARCAASTGQRALRRRRLESRRPSFRRCSAYGDRLGRRRARRICVARRRVGGRRGGGSAERRGCVGCNMRDDSRDVQALPPAGSDAPRCTVGCAAGQLGVAPQPVSTGARGSPQPAGRPAPALPPCAGPTAAKRRLRAASDAARPRHESARMNAMRALPTLPRRLRESREAPGSSGRSVVGPSPARGAGLHFLRAGSRSGYRRGCGARSGGAATLPDTC